MEWNKEHLSYVKSIGLDAMELLFVRNVNVTEKNSQPILQYVLEKLGISALDDMHIHMGGIKYSEKGEIKHLPILESDFDVKGCIIVEGPMVEKDALLVKNAFEKL